MTDNAPLTGDQAYAGAMIDALDLEPVVYRLMHPYPGQTAMSLAEADQIIAEYRGFLKLCAWYPGESIVPSKTIDSAWHEHILDTAKYTADCMTVFGHVANHFPYFGQRGAQDEARWHAAYERTRELFRLHFGIALSGSAAAGECVDGSCEHTIDAARNKSRPRPDRTAAAHTSPVRA
jgi:hypothetical protein